MEFLLEISYSEMGGILGAILYNNASGEPIRRMDSHEIDELTKSKELVEVKCAIVNHFIEEGYCLAKDTGESFHQDHRDKVCFVGYLLINPQPESIEGCGM